MKNSEISIYPKHNLFTEQLLTSAEEKTVEDYNKLVRGKGSNSEGLTKREHFAGLAMQGSLAGRQNISMNNIDNVTIKMMVSVSIRFADELLGQIDKE